MRFTLIRIRENEHLLLRVNHHILSDGWSWNVYFREFAVLYEAKVRGEAPPLPEFEPLQYADYSAWQREALQPERPTYRATVTWWKDFLQKPPRPFNLPFKRKMPVTGLDAALGTLSWGVPPETTTRLDELRRTEAVTYFMVRLAAFVALLATSTGERDVVIGSYLSNRNRITLQNMFGFFSNLATLRFRFDPGRTFREWLSEVRMIVTAVEAHCDIPYEELSKELSAQSMPLPAINVIVNAFTAHPEVRFAGIDLMFMERRDEVMPWGFGISSRNRTKVAIVRRTSMRAFMIPRTCASSSKAINGSLTWSRVYPTGRLANCLRIETQSDEALGEVRPLKILPAVDLIASAKDFLRA